MAEFLGTKIARQQEFDGLVAEFQNEGSTLEDAVNDAVEIMQEEYDITSLYIYSKCSNALFYSCLPRNTQHDVSFQILNLPKRKYVCREYRRTSSEK